jgi:hypothetical protein
MPLLPADPIGQNYQPKDCYTLFRNCLLDSNLERQFIQLALAAFRQMIQSERGQQSEIGCEYQASVGRKCRCTI